MRCNNCMKEVSVRDRICPHCGHMMDIKARKPILLRHIPIGNWHTFIQVNVSQFECPHCG
ncbi:MAG: transposase family protein, partial [Lachnospiraceae bacterium]|nr:transposase family protein [Lachnospiraceae bacterium]